MKLKVVNIDKVVKILKDFYPIHTMQANYKDEPFKVLVSCVMSLRNLDEVTFPIAAKLFEIADTPEKIANMTHEELKSIIKSINYYDTKALNIINMSKTIVERYNSKVPDTMEELLEFKGVGRKTANVVLAVGFNIPAIAVDTHVHKISNRLGYVKTITPEETEQVLRKILPKKHWIALNELFVLHGKQICKTRNPQCSICPILEFCNQVGI